jgi:hypothetical protein
MEKRCVRVPAVAVQHVEKEPASFVVSLCANRVKERPKEKPFLFSSSFFLSFLSPQAEKAGRLETEKVGHRRIVYSRVEQAGSQQSTKD